MGLARFALLELAEQKFASRLFLDAKKILQEILGSEPNNSRVNELLAYILWGEGNSERGLELLQKAVSVSECSASALYELAVIYTNQGRYSEASDLFQGALNKSGGFFELYHEYGRALASDGHYQQSLEIFTKAEAINPSSVEVLFNLGRLNELLKNSENAMAYYDKALNLNSAFVPALNNKAMMLNDSRKFGEAIASYDHALIFEPDNVELLSNKGNSLINMHRHSEAVEVFTKALSIDPDYFGAIESLANVLSTLKQYANALPYAEKALLLNPQRPYLYGLVVHLRSLICNWKHFNQDVIAVQKLIEAGQKTILPFQALCLFDDPKLQYQCSSIFSASADKLSEIDNHCKPHSENKKIRIAYFSSDFGYHPVSFLIAEVFELHDRSSFDVIGFSVGPNTKDPMRTRLEDAFDEFYDVLDLQDEDIAKLSRELKIDIAIDLTGYTQDSRTNIFSFKAAAVQVNYLGYPGTLVTPYIDYIIADTVLIPELDQQFYSEKIAYLPNSYQPNDRSRNISKEQLTREMYGLSEQQFVFCCFNNNFKITPTVFEKWMQILKKCDQGVLWLLEDNIDASNNLRMAAQESGISVDRLIFATREPMDKHIARMRLANLFLDTSPYNAHTTASDALWAGLPVLTYLGKSFASRVAASLVNAVHLPEMVVQSLDDYVQTAVSLSKSPARLEEIRCQLDSARASHPLFDTVAYVAGLEKAFVKMHELALAHKPPATFYIH